MHIRKKLITWLFNRSEKIYTTYFKKSQPWGLTRDDLLRQPDGSLGHRLGLFLLEHNFELLPKVERHDVYHIITGYGTAVEDEIAQQYLCLGNGKRSLYLIGVISIGTILLPEYTRYYYDSYQKGKQAAPFHHYQYQSLLHTNFDTFRNAIFSSQNLRVPYDQFSAHKDMKARRANSVSA